MCMTCVQNGDRGQPRPAQEVEMEAGAPRAGNIESAEGALAFVLGGSAIFTLRSAKTGVRYTFRVSRAKDKADMYFVGTLTGPDNSSDYEYLGFLKTDAPDTLKHGYDGGVLIAGKKGRPGDVRFRGLDWVLRALARGKLPADVEFWHEGRCARCARRLTDPASIERGFGPECAGKL